MGFPPGTGASPSPCRWPSCRLHLTLLLLQGLAIAAGLPSLCQSLQPSSLLHLPILIVIAFPVGCMQTSEDCEDAFPETTCTSCKNVCQSSFGTWLQAQNVYFSSTSRMIFLHPQKSLMFIKCHIVIEGNCGQKLRALMHPSILQ